MTREGIATLAGWVPEETHVFAASVAGNLRLARPSATVLECLAALDRVGLRPWSDGLPGGLATRLGAGGLPMSGGEQQRLGLARALLAGPSVLLLDEPTAHLDPATGDRVLRELLDAAGERSVLVVSHDQAISQHVDSVVALDDGRVARVSPGGRPGRPQRLAETAAPGPSGF
jgi:ABC-type transport system involved in cytochrome bd biosynthesis fused ATPase/permease subunit